MVGEVLIDLFFGIFTGLFSALNVISLPTNLIGVLGNIMAFGNWIVGLDLLGIFVGCIVFWWGVHLSIGIAVWLWKLLPLT